jgi:energy-coupling factor transporter ATP-binding protein EcfA2
MDAAYLQLDHIDKSFARGSMTTEVLKGIVLPIEKGEFVAIIGHSGCGKSTLLNIIAGLTPATSGGVILEAREVSAPGPDRAVVDAATGGPIYLSSGRRRPEQRRKLPTECVGDRAPFRAQLLSRWRRPAPFAGSLSG